MATLSRDAIAAGNCHSASWFDFTGALRHAYAILASLLLTLDRAGFQIPANRAQVLNGDLMRIDGEDS
jgi:hypothetical protein